MEIYENLKRWLEERGLLPAVDRCGYAPESLGLFPQGVRVLKQWEDVTGRKRRKVRYGFLLRLVAVPGEDTALRLLQLQADAPAVGFSATDGSLKKAASDGLGIYEIRLSAEREEYL